MSFFSLDICFWEDFLIILFSYSLFKYLIFSLLIELIWPTNYFNKKHFFSNNFKYRTFIETILKLKNSNSYFNTKFYYILIFFLYK